ncbi:MAG TPA: hypothetical protein VGI17_13940 [Solirubrobacterales bacterium]
MNVCGATAVPAALTTETLTAVAALLGGATAKSWLSETRVKLAGVAPKRR